MNKNSKRFTTFSLPPSSSHARGLHERGFAHLFLVIIVVIIGIGGLLYFSWQKGFIKTRTSPEAPPMLIVESEVTADWKTYANTVAGYILKYPPGWEPTTKAPGLGLDEADPTSQSINCKSITVSFFDFAPSDARYSEWQKERVYINNVEATRYQKLDSANSLDKVFYLFYNPNTAKYIQYYTENTTLENIKVFDQILSTFKFLED